MKINNLPIEIQNKIFYFLEHPTATLIKHAVINYEGNENITNQTSYFVLVNPEMQLRHVFFRNDTLYWNCLIGDIQFSKIYRRELDELIMNNKKQKITN